MSFEDMTHVIRAAALKGYQEVMRDCGVPARPLLADHGLSPEDLADDDALLPMEAVCGLLEASSLAAQCPDLGLRIARHQDLAVLGILGLAIQTAATPAEASKIISRFIFLQGTALRMRAEVPGRLVPDTVAMVLEIDGIAPNRQRQIIELILGMGFQVGRMRDPWAHKVRAVSLPHGLGTAGEPHRRFFAVPVHENQTSAALHMDARDWHVPDPNSHPRFQRLMEDHLERNFPVPAQRLSDRVRAALRPLIGTPQANRADIAHMLAIEPRTLHRQLRAEGTSFQEIKDSARRDLALKHLTETDVTLDQLAGMLGFPEQSALSRACRRWFGTPPGALRRARRADTDTAVRR
ncbi:MULTISPECIES: AraC family transcriptional regulator [Marinovum]|nr:MULTISPECIES: AraC family transcriptional regulator [Marinovum]MDD9740856.1 AraC family transcriptional regulator ligand-binding domain-containing protein [Marinovum sp. SP66]